MQGILLLLRAVLSVGHVAMKIDHAWHQGLTSGVDFDEALVRRDQNLGTEVDKDGVNTVTPNQKVGQAYFAGTRLGWL